MSDLTLHPWAESGAYSQREVVKASGNLSGLEYSNYSPLGTGPSRQPKPPIEGPIGGPT